MTTTAERKTASEARAVSLDTPLPPGKDYHAFLSYKRDPDAPIAAAIERGLERLACPWLAWRAIHVCRDATALAASHDLGHAIRRSLDRSEYLILLASSEAFVRVEPNRLTWVEQELDHWLNDETRRTKLLICATGGTGASWRETTAIPEEWKDRLETEPNFVDLTWARNPETRGELTLRDPRFANAVAQLSSTIRDIPRPVLFSEDQRQHRLLVRFRRFAISGLVALLLASLVLAAWALFNAARTELKRRVADTQGQIADVENELATRARQRSDAATWIANVNQRIAALNEREATMQRDDAERQSTINDARRLAALAESVRADYPERSALLAVNAANTLARTGKTDLQVRDVVHKAWRALAGSVAMRQPGLSVWALSPDGRTLATGGRDGSIRLWNVADPTPSPRLLDGKGGIVNVLAFSPDGRRLMSSSGHLYPSVPGRDANTTIWRVADGVSLGSVPQTAAEIEFSPAGDFVAARLENGAAVVWPVTFAGLGFELAIAPKETAYAIAFSADGSSLTVGNGDGTATLRRTSTLVTDAASIVLRGDDDALVTTLAFSPDGRWLLTSGEPAREGDPRTGRCAYLWRLDRSGGTPRRYELPLIVDERTLPGSRGVSLLPFRRRKFIQQAEFNASSKWLLIRTDRGALQLWRLPQPGKESGAEDLRGRDAAPPQVFGAVVDAAFDPSGSAVAIATDEKGVYIAGLWSDPPQFRALKGAIAQPLGVEFTEQGSHLLSAGNDGKVGIWQWNVAQPAPTVIAGQEGRLRGLMTTADGRWLLAVTAPLGGDGVVRRYRFDAAAGSAAPERLAAIPRAEEAVASPDSKWLAASNDDGTSLVAIDPSNAVLTRDVPGYLVGGSFSPRSRWLTTADDDHLMFTAIRTKRAPVVRQLPVDPLRSREDRLVENAQWDPNERSLIVSNREGSNWLFAADPNDVPVLRARLTGPGWSGGSSFSDDGHWLFVQQSKEYVGPMQIASYGRVRLFDLRSPAAIREHAIPLPVVRSGVFAGQHVAFTDTHGTAYVWKLPFTAAPPIVLPVDAAAERSDGRNDEPNLDGVAAGWIVTLPGSDALLWDVTVTPPRRIDVSPRTERVFGASRVTFSDDGRWLAVVPPISANEKSSITLCRIDGRHVRVRMLPFENWAQPIVRFSPDGRWLAVATLGVSLIHRSNAFPKILLWDLRRVDERKDSYSLIAHDRNIVDLRFSDDSRQLVSVANDHGIVAWNLTEPSLSHAYTVLREGMEVDEDAKAQIFVDRRTNDVIAVREHETVYPRVLLIDRIPTGGRAVVSAIRAQAGRSLTEEERDRFPPSESRDAGLLEALGLVRAERDAGERARGETSRDQPLTIPELDKIRPPTPKPDDADLTARLATLRRDLQKHIHDEDTLRWWHFRTILRLVAT